MRLARIILCPLLALPALIRADVPDRQPVRIANPVNGHIHPAVCISKSGVIAKT